MIFVLELNCDSAAFAEQPLEEIARLLRVAADRVEEDMDAEVIHLRDINGNTVGWFGFEPAP